MGECCPVGARRDRTDSAIGSVEWLLARLRKSRGHARVWQHGGRELVLVLVEHRQLAERASKHQRRRTTATNNLSERYIVAACKVSDRHLARTARLRCGRLRLLGHGRSSNLRPC